MRLRLRRCGREREVEGNEVSEVEERDGEGGRGGGGGRWVGEGDRI